jgi:hypothetical protein
MTKLLRVLFPLSLPWRIHHFMQRFAAPAKAVEVFTRTYLEKLK